MASLRDDEINFSKLESGAHAAQERESLYWLQNDAKFRAVKQKGTYDDFKDIVAAAHLKPLDKGDKLQFEDRITVAWNPTISGKGTPASKSAGAMKSNPTDQPATTSIQFTRSWRMIKGSKERCQFLCKTCQTEDLQALFRTEIPFGLLGDFIDCVHANLDTVDHQLIFDMLNKLIHTGRFSLSLTFLGSAEKDRLRSILDTLTNHGLDITKLTQAYLS